VQENKVKSVQCVCKMDRLKRMTEKYIQMLELKCEKRIYPTDITLGHEW